MNVLVAVPVGALASAFLVAALRRHAPRDAATEESHKQNQVSVPLVGGTLFSILLPIAWFAGALEAWPLPIFLGALVSVATGLLDDMRKARGFPWFVKLAGQCLAASSAFFVDASALSVPPWALFAFLVVAQNAWNFFDNFDGNVAWLAIAAGALTILYGEASRAPAALVLGVALGFLFFNWPRARAYLGDGGAHGFGFAFAWLATGSFASPVHGIVGLHAVVLLDMVQVIAVRLALRIPPWRGDKRHLAHRLGGVLSPAGVAPLLAFVAFAIGLLVFGVMGPSDA